MNRRHFLKNFSRWTMGATLLGGGAALLASRSNHRCIMEVPHCKSCKVLASCARPQALSYKQFKEKNDASQQS